MAMEATVRVDDDNDDVVEGRDNLRRLADLLEARGLEYERRRDSRCVFTLAYSLMTRRLAEAFGKPATPLDQPEADTVDWAWIALLASAFGRRYFVALDAVDALGAPDAVEQQGTPPPAWAHVFGTLRDSRTSVLEELLFPMTVHIVRDLPHALIDIGQNNDGLRHLAEFHHVNNLMEDAIDDVQALLLRRYGPFTGWLDHFAGGVDEILTDYGIRVSRAAAWYNASRIADPASTEDAIHSIERSPRILVEMVMNPPLWSMHILFRALRFVAALTRTWPRPGTPLPPLAAVSKRARAAAAAAAAKSLPRPAHQVEHR
jgi:hypothetical protein